MKVGKATGPDDIHPEFLLHAGDTTNKWLCQYMSTILERCKIPTIWRKATVSTPSLTSPRTTLRATCPSHCCASHSSCLKRWSMDVSTPSLIPSYRMNERTIDRRPGYTANTGHWGLFWGQRDSLRCPSWSNSSISYYVALRVYLKAPLDAAR